MMKEKVLVVPFITDSHGRVRFLVVKEARYDEWTFVCGNCKHGEKSNPLNTALRELREETKDTLVVSTPLKYIFKYKSFVTTDKGVCSHKHQQILFHVFVINIQGINSGGIIKNYYTRMKTGYKSTQRCYMETIGISFMTITDLSTKRLWPFIINNVLYNDSFWLDVAYLRNENYKRSLQNDKQQRSLSFSTTWGNFKCSPGSIGRLELVPRRTLPYRSFQPRVCRYVRKTQGKRYFIFAKTSNRNW